jgi:hypothetical protein
MSAQRRRGALGAAAATLVLAGIAGCGGMRDTGGSVVAASTAMLQARASGQPVEIRGTCYSACALKLASGNGLCIAPSARIGVHEVRRAISPARYGLGARDDFATAFFETLLPRCAHDLFASLHGFGSGTLTVVSGRDILAACPQIRACPDSRFASTERSGHL